MEHAQPQDRSPDTPSPGPMSLRAYAKRRGQSLKAVQRAIAEHRLEASVGLHRGRAAILDPELADREWHERTRPRPSGSSIPSNAPPTVTDEDDAIPTGLSLIEAERLHAVERARLSRIKRETDELELAKLKGELVPADEARASVVDLFSTVRTKLLGVAARVKQRLPHIAHDDVREIDALVREALEDLAEGRE